VAVAAVTVADPPLSRAAVRRAAVSDILLAAEDEGEFYLEVLAGKGDTSQSLAIRYAGNKSAAPLIRAANGGAEPAAGKFYKIPSGVLLEDHRRRVLAALYPDELPVPPLKYKSDRKGKYAEYRLQRGEALYSAVVVRFTGRMDVQEVNELASRIARRSGIRNVRSIPAGYPVKIPQELLFPEFQPPDSPARKQREAEVVATARHGLSAGVLQLAGVHVILDAGHGGKDPGAMRMGIYEDEHAYDVMCRVVGLLKEKTEAEVYTTIYDRSSKYRPLRGRIHQDTDESLVRGTVQDNQGKYPAFDGRMVLDLRRPGTTKNGVNKRFELANQRFGDLRKRGIDGERVVFLSFHADALHRSIRGAMIYVPGSESAGALPRGVSPREREKAMGLSRKLAREIISGLRNRKVFIHPKPTIRDRIIRGRRSFIPGVVRESKVPHALLIEIANLNNSKDRRLLVKTEFRQRFAEAVVDSLVSYYASVGRDRSAEVARLD
jgi:N-acetylmuramoyl-L-alanine amidase